MSSQTQLNRESAQSIAEKTIHSLKPVANFVVLREKTLERDFGWVFFYSPRRYLETGDPGTLVPGAGPIMILRKDGAAHFLPTSLPPDAAVRKFEEQWRSHNP